MCGIMLAIVQLDDTICYCFHIRKRKILNFIRIHSPRGRQSDQRMRQRGDGVRVVRAVPEAIFEEARAGIATNPDQLTPEEYARMQPITSAKGKGRRLPGRYRCRRMLPEGAT